MSINMRKTTRNACWVVLGCVLAYAISGLALRFQINNPNHKMIAEEMYQISLALEIFKKDMGRFPSNEEGVLSLFLMPQDVQSNEWNGPYMDSQCVTKMVQRYQYEAQQSCQAYRVTGPQITNGSIGVCRIIYEGR